MAKDLVIVESPTKARTITRILGNDYKIMASMGHVRDLPEKSLGVDVENDFKPTYKTSGRKNVLDELSKAVKTADHVYLAPDPDREGEAIAWHLYELLKKKNKEADFHRVTFHEITKNAVSESFEHPGSINMNLVDAQQARRVLDRLVGYKVSPLLWKKVVRGTSAGRVQSVALRLICERQQAIDEFEPQEYWILTGLFEKGMDPQKFEAKLVKLDGEKFEVDNGKLATEYADDAQAADYAVSSVKKAPRQRRAQPPFITSTLQQAASANLRMSPEQTMRVAQQLYEGADSKSDSGGLITYMRTDSFNVATVAQQAAREFITNKFGADFVPPKPNRYRSKGSAQEAHEAIRPTDVTLTPDKASKFLDSRQARLYDLIWKRFVASQMAPARMSRYTVELENTSDAKHKYTFRATSTKIIFPGYMQVYNLQDVKEDKKDEDEEDRKIPELKQGDDCKIVNLDKDQKFTEPPPLFSEAMLVRELDRNGVGRPSTYASIIGTIKKRKYVESQKGKLIPTDLGKEVNGYLVENLDSLFQVNFTARMESELDNVEEGKTDWVGMLRRFYSNFDKWLSEAHEKTNVPETAIVRQVLDLFHDKVDWAPPEKSGRRTYDDKKFYNSLCEQLDKKKKDLSDRQWAALLSLVAKYKDQLNDVEGTMERLGLQDEFAPIKEKVAEQQRVEPDEHALKLCSLLDSVKEWEEPANEKSRDDKAFITSLREQAERKPLTQRQIRALKTVIKKYASQIPQYEEVREELDLPEPLDDQALERLKKTLAMADEIEKFNEPTKRGRRTYDDKEFVESLKRQLNEKGSLSDRQIAALGKMLAKYKKQIKNFDERAKELGIEAGKQDTASEMTDVTCPKCEKAKMAKKIWRGRVFYGCSAYPKCKYSVNSLDKIQP